MPISRLTDIISDPKKAAWVIIGLAVALCFALGFSITTWDSNRSLQVRVDSIISQKDLTERAAKKAAYDNCIKSKPTTTGLINVLIDTATKSRDNGFKVLKITPTSSPLYKARINGYNNYKDLVIALKGYLPIKCGPKPGTEPDVPLSKERKSAIDINP